MTVEAENEREALASVLAGALDDVVGELRMIDLVDLVSYIRFGDHPAIEDLLEASTELFFRQGTLTFGWTATVDMDWHDLPIVTLGMEFRHRAVTIFFDLSLDATNRIVEVSAAQFGEHCHGGSDRVASLAEALSDARCAGKAVRPI